MTANKPQTQLEAVARAIWNTSQDHVVGDPGTYALKMRLSWDEALRAAKNATGALRSTAPVDTPMGEQPFDQAVRWHVPTILRWLRDNRSADRAPDGTLVGEVLRIAAEMIEHPRSTTPQASEDAEWQPQIGEQVVVTSTKEWASDWVDAAGNPLELWVAGIRAMIGGGYDVTVADETQWPLKAHRPFEGVGLTDGFIVGRADEQDDLARLRRIANTLSVPQNAPNTGDASGPRCP